MAPERLRSRALSAFKLRGLLLRGEAIKYLTEALQSVSEVELEDALEKIIDAVEKQPLSSNMIERSVVEAAVQECSQSVDETIEHIFNIIGAFDIPRFVYNSERKKFLPLLMTNHPKPNLFGTARDKAELFRERYTILHQRTHRHELFTPPVIGSHPDESGSKFQLKTIETLLGNTTKIGDVIVLGMITQLKEVGLKIKCFMSMPLDFHPLSLLALLGYSPAPPTCFILCGNFSSAPYGKKQVQALKDSLKTLADIICEYPNIHQSSRFVFVPGPEDPGFGSILPRPPLAESITNEFRQRVPFSVFTTNPCRIQYCTQEIIVFREDLVNKMCRNCVRFPSSNLDIPNHFVKTILSQGHLTPLPLYVCPVYWAYDYALRVYPLPDVLVIADKYDPFTLTNTECLCINPQTSRFLRFLNTIEETKLIDFLLNFIFYVTLILGYNKIMVNIRMLFKFIFYEILIL
ncbi:DNA polymerase epsilon subunit 2 isoform X11 [Pipistrellus kuhlii]|uniref:DNA polymerase epsilon subunit 2 isoform X11 n=1 Tax=Pipistrellus kuhlii TaxID=59472 RepID=UPI001E26E9D2|nr:DNA polymerase epsilon subunit 2 isoform X11 [Pipistrellus kuhlii]